MKRLEKIQSIRTREIDLVLSELRITSNTRILEVGCGEGFQSRIMSKKGFVIPTDVTKKRILFKLPHFLICSALYLPFKDKLFNIVYSSNVLEHIEERENALDEMHRVMRKDGTLICVVPTAFWKILQMITYYPYILGRLLTRSFGKEELPCGTVSRRGFFNRSKREYQCGKKRESLFRFLKPNVHGIFKSNIEELKAYMMNQWIRLLETQGFNVYLVKKLLIHTPHNFSLFPAFLHLEKTGLCSAIALFATKN